MDNCRLAANTNQQDTDVDAVGDVCDMCVTVPNPSQSDVDLDGTGDACDLTVLSPVIAQALSCASGDQPPTISWEPWVYEKFKVYLSTDPAFPKGKKVTSGKPKRILQWTVTADKWSKICGLPGTTVYIKVRGTDLNVPKTDPNRKAFSATVTPVKQ